MAGGRDAIVVGAGPNGLAAAIRLAQAGVGVTVFEADTTVGGGTRTRELTLPGFLHDVCSAVHPMARVSPFFRDLQLDAHGVTWIDPPTPLAHPFDDGSAAVLERSVAATAAGLGRDEPAYQHLFGRLVRDWSRLEANLLAPIRWPRHPWALAHFGWFAMQPASALVRRQFAETPARSLVAGIAAHSMLPLDRRPTGAIALVLAAAAHVVGWPLARGGSAAIAQALADRLLALGGRIITGSPVRSLDDLPSARAIVCDLSPRPFLAVAGPRLPPAYRRALERYRYGPAAFKVDFALSAPVPWRADACRRAATVHLCGSIDDIERSEREVGQGRVPERPFVLLVQPSLFDDTRAPAGQHVVWAYCHVPNGSDADMLPRIEAQIERFAPGFRSRVIARSVLGPRDLERYNPNFVGGDISAGANDLWQFFARPTWRQYSTPVPGLYLCSAATPPGVGVHGMCGYFAAERVLRDLG